MIVLTEYLTGMLQENQHHLTALNVSDGGLRGPHLMHNNLLEIGTKHDF